MHNDNKLVIALGIFSILLLICLCVVLIHKNHSYDNPSYTSKTSIENSNKNNFATSKKITTEKKLNNILSSTSKDNDNNSIVNNINYTYRDKFLHFQSTNEVVTDDSINELLEEIESEEKTQPEIDEESIQLTLEKNKFFVYLKHFEDETDALRLINYLKYQNYNAFLKTANSKYYFVIVEFEERAKADTFVIWAKNNSFQDASIIQK